MAIFNLDNQIILKPNNSLTTKGGLKVISMLAGIVLLVAFGFTNMGAWLVLPFAGLELIAISYAFYYMHRHSADFESITIANDQVVVEKKDDKKITKTVFQRYWAQVNIRKVVDNTYMNGGSGLFINSHGNEVEFGRKYINDEQRVMLARELKQKLRSIY